MSEITDNAFFVLLGFGLGMFGVYILLLDRFRELDKLIARLKEAIKKNESLLINETKDQP